MLPEYRLEVQFVCHVEIGGNRFRVTVHYNGFVSAFLNGQKTVYTTIIKFNSLSNAVGAAA